MRGKRCLLTGAASGIGRATAISAAAKGADLYLTDVQAEGLDGVVEEIRLSGGNVCYAKALDVSDHDAVVAMGAEIQATGVSMDVVMNIAGVSTWGRIEQLEHSDWQQMVDVNLIGPISVLECFVPPMIEAGRGGHVVNVSSAAGLFGLPWHAAYSASKFGLRGVSEVLRFDLRRHRIGVTLVCPGAVKTPLAGLTADGGTVKIVGVDRSSPAVRRLFERFLRRAATPEQVAENIITGIEGNRYLVYTSTETRVLHWLQRVFPPSYEWAMRYLNGVMHSVAGRS